MKHAVDAEQILRQARPITDQEAHEIQPFNHLVRMPIALDENICRESVENLTACDRPIGWTQHVTLGPPFLERGRTEFRASATRSKVFEQPFGVADDLAAGALFDWPLAPRVDGGFADLRRFTDALASSAYTAHLMNTSDE